MYLPKLFQLTATGKIQMWHITTEGPYIVTVFGQVGGAKQTNREEITEGKNVGRSNETTPKEQAQAEAKSRWERKVKKGYNQDFEAAKAGTVDAKFVAGGVKPMLAHKYVDHGRKIAFPAWAQPKFDGHRCIAIVNDDATVGLWSRTCKPITGVPHVARAIEALRMPAGTILDGELYNHDYRNNFEDLTSFIRQTTPKPGHEVVEYHIYDLAAGGDDSEEMGYNPDLYIDRYQVLNGMIPSSDPVLKVTETIKVDDAEHLADWFTHWLAKGYEGAMVRNQVSPYKNGRSYDLQKVKVMQDAEYEIIGVKAGSGAMADKAIFVCKMDDGQTFSVKMEGALDDLRQYLTNPDLAIGRMLTVRFQDLTSAGLPRFPVGERFRVDL